MMTSEQKRLHMHIGNAYMECNDNGKLQVVIMLTNGLGIETGSHVIIDADEFESLIKGE